MPCSVKLEPEPGRSELSLNLIRMVPFRSFGVWKDSQLRGTPVTVSQEKSAFLPSMCTVSTAGAGSGSRTRTAVETGELPSIRSRAAERCHSYWKCGVRIEAAGQLEGN